MGRSLTRATAVPTADDNDDLDSKALEVVATHATTSSMDSERQDAATTTGTAVARTTTSSLCLSVWQYFTLIQRNPGYRLYLLSHVCQDVGDWFVKIGSVLAIKRLSSSSGGSAVAYLMLTIMLPQLFLSPIGGVLADMLDKRKCMLVLDVLSGTVVFGYLWALHASSIPLLYLVSTLRTVIASLYDPLTRSILPLIVTDAQDLKRAVSLNYLAWSIMRIFGGLLAGFISAWLGIGACFVVDSATYYFSAIVLFFLRGNFNVRSKPDDNSGANENGDNDRPPGVVVTAARVCFSGVRMMKTAAVYLWKSRLWALVFLRFTGASVWGWADVLNVTYTNVEDNEALSSEHLGILMSFLGGGCLVGPPLANLYTKPEKPSTIQAVCIVGMVVMGMGWAGILASPDSFWRICLFSGVRTVGASIIITNSLLLMQQVIDKKFLGRVLSVEFALTMGVDSLTNWMAGKLQDLGLSKEHIAMVAILISIWWIGGWTIYHKMLGGGKRLDAAVVGGGAASFELVRSDDDNDQDYYDQDQLEQNDQENQAAKTSLKEDEVDEEFVDEPNPNSD